MLTDPRTGLVYPDPTNELDSADVPRDLAAIVGVLVQMALFSQGPIASQPISTVGSPGKQGRFYYATDTTDLWYDYGTGWIQLTTFGKAKIWQAAAGGAFPGGPFTRGDTLEYSIADPVVSGNIVWEFVYRDDLDAGFPWHFKGGSPLGYSYVGDISVSQSAGVWAAAGAFTGIVIPRAGVYTIYYKSDLHDQAPPNQVYISPATAAAGGSLAAGTIRSLSSLTASGGNYDSVSGIGEAQLAAADVLKLYRYFVIATNVDITYNILSIVPVRII